MHLTDTGWEFERTILSKQGMIKLCTLNVKQYNICILNPQYIYVEGLHWYSLTIDYIHACSISNATSNWLIFKVWHLFQSCITSVRIKFKQCKEYKVTHRIHWKRGEKVNVWRWHWLYSKSDTHKGLLRSMSSRYYEKAKTEEFASEKYGDLLLHLIDYCSWQQYTYQ